VGKIKDVDGNWYKTIKIGDQWWMAENLKTTKYNDKTPISNVTGGTEWVGLTSGAYCWHDNDIANKAIYGALYNWYVVDATSNGGKNVCPTDWHVPTDGEWHQLVLFLDPNSTLEPWDESLLAGGKLKEVGNTHWEPAVTVVTNETGFTALPGGCRNFSDGLFSPVGSAGYWLSASEYSINTNAAWYRGLFYNSGTVKRHAYMKTEGFSIRCLKN
jgi:uncharacterized protein (TIGR02145 family)